jgi:hypothetical protein
MAKDNPDGMTAQYKVFIRPTDVGLLVMQRLQRPALDKSAELRRLIELGYAAEQAGFILDGTILKNGGRVWDIQPVLVNQDRPARVGPNEQAQIVTCTPEVAISVASSGTGSKAHAVNDEKTPSGTKTTKSAGLRANLRNLS